MARPQGGASDEEQKAERMKPSLKLRWLQGCAGAWQLRPPWEEARCLSSIFIPLPHGGERPVAVPEGRYALPRGTCTAPSW